MSVYVCLHMRIRERMQAREADSRARWAEQYLFESAIVELVRRRGFKS